MDWLVMPTLFFGLSRSTISTRSSASPDLVELFINSTRTVVQPLFLVSMNASVM